MRVKLIVIDGPHKGQEFSFGQHDTFLVGRSRHAHFQLPAKDKYFSRIHFMVEVNPPQCRLVDMGSHNGTFVNGQRILSADLNHKDEIRAGHTVLQLNLEAEASDSDIAVAAGKSAEEQGFPEQVPDFLPGYRLERELGRGSMGRVFEATRTLDGAKVAIKTVLPARSGTAQQIADFLHAGRRLTGLDHPNIVKLLDLGEIQGTLFFVMEYVAGKDAASHLKAQGPLPVWPALRLILPILKALEYGHGLQVVHRDIKPANILVAGEGDHEIVKLADYGLARVYQASALSGLTVTQNIAASAPFMPPELITNYHGTNPSSDQYAAAASLYWLLTGQPVYNFPKEMHLQFSLLLQQQPIPIRQRRPDLSEGLAGVIHKALNRNIGHRFPDVNAFRQALLDAGGK